MSVAEALSPRSLANFCAQAADLVRVRSLPCTRNGRSRHFRQKNTYVLAQFPSDPLPGLLWARCLPDASQMPLRCLSDASQMSLRCFPDAKILFGFSRSGHTLKICALRNSKVVIPCEIGYIFQGFEHLQKSDEYCSKVGFKMSPKSQKR